MGKHDFCVECAPKNIHRGAVNLADLINAAESPEKLQNLLSPRFPKNTRFPDEAFMFVKQGIDMAVAEAGFTDIPATVLLEKLRTLALMWFREKAKSTLAGWNVHCTEDFGEIVFAMVDAGLLGKRPEDKIEDFANGFNFDEAFPEN
jgi:uncharacterized repeat protein (TIGR04138 family)